MFRATFLPAFLTATFILCDRGAGADVILLIHPKCPLDKDAKLDGLACHTLGAKEVQVVQGDKPKAAGLKGEGYVIELPAPVTTTDNLTINAVREGAAKSETFAYTQVYLL